MDKDLIKRVKDGDESAVIEFINQYRQKIYWTAYRLTVNKEDALDITQDVFVKFINNIKKIDETKIVDAYIHRITVNCAYDYLRTRFKTSRFQDVLQMLTRKQQTPAESYKRSELREKVFRAVNKLSAKERKIIILYYFHDLKIREIAEALNITEGTIKKQMFRAKAKLEHILRKEVL